MPTDSESDDTSSVAKPAVTPNEKGSANLSPFAHLTKNSARLIQCQVVVYHPTARSRKYMYQSQERVSHHFQCFLVSTSDLSEYMLGDAHGKGMTEAKLTQLKERFKPGLVFHMSKIHFANNVPRQ